MHKWLLDGIFTASLACVIGGGTVLLTSSGSIGVVSGGLTGGIATSFIARRRQKDIFESFNAKIDKSTNKMYEKILKKLESEKDEINQQGNKVIDAITIELDNQRVVNLQSIRQDLNDEQKSTLEFLQLQIDTHKKLVLETFKNEITINMTSNLESFEKEINNQKRLFLEWLETTVDNQDLSNILSISSSKPKIEAHDEIGVSNLEENIFISGLANCNSIRDFFYSLNIGIECPKIDENSTFEIALRETAEYLGENYDVLSAFHRRLCSHFRIGKFVFDLKNNSQKEIQVHHQFTNSLRDNGFISRKSYDSDNRRLVIQTHSQRADLDHFFHGTWLEKFIYIKLVKLFEKHALNYEVLLNPVLIYSNGDRYEIDLFFYINQNPIWIECKAGRNVDKSFSQYSSHRKALKIPKSNAIVVCAQLSSDQAKIRTEQWDLMIVNCDLIFEYIESLILKN